ncbi:hypothetical protein IAT40_005204 [Kwoniella sp. CBS 6097]
MASVEELAGKYSSQLSQLRAIFPTWDEGDLAFTLQDVKGNVEEAAMAITEGRASQFTQASRKKPVKSKDAPRAHTNRNADTGGWEAVNGEGFRGDRGARGGRGGARGGRGGRGGEPFRGGRGGRGGFRGGRGGFTNTNGQPKATPTEGFPTTTDTTTEGWANQVQQAASADAAATEQDSEANAASAVADTSKGEDFAGSGGWGDAPAPKELEQAAKSGGTGWQKDIEKPVQVAPSSVPAAAKPKLTWAQIAKPVEKPKPVPPPAPVVPEPEPVSEPEPETTSDEPVAQDDVEVAPEVLEEKADEEVAAWGDAPAPEEIKEEAAAAVETAAPAAEEPFTSSQAEDLLPEEPTPAAAAEPTASADAWESDPAIAGSGAQPDWAKPEAQAPEPVTTYQGPPGFNSVVSKAAPGVQAAQQPRSSSRAAQRYKDAEGQGVVLPPTAGSGLAGMEMQFGSLSFGGLNGDGVDSPVPAVEPKQETPVQAAPAPAAPIAASPVRSTQTSAPSQPQPVVAPTPPHIPASTATSSAPSAPFYSQPAQTQSTPAAAPQQQQSFSSPHQTLQQQMQAYQYLQQQQAPAQSQTPDQGLHQSQGNQFYRQHDFYNQIGSQAPQQQQQSNEAQGQQQTQGQQSSQQQQPSASPYDTSFGGFGQQSHLFGQPAQQQSQHTPSNDPYAAAHRVQSYDSYAASGYPRPPVEEPKSSAPAASHAGAAPSHAPHQQSGYYSQMGNMGYYQQGPYNPYYQYGQAPQGGFQQYYPLAARNLYGQPAPQAPPAPIPSSKPQPPTSHSPYGGPPSYPSSATYDDQSFGGLGRYGDSKTQGGQGAQGQTPAQAQQGQGQSTLAPGSYNSQSGAGGIHNFLGSSGSSAASQANRPQATTPDDGFKSAQGAVGAQSRASAAGGPQQGLGPQAQHGFASYPYGGGYGGQDWGQYGGHYGSRNGYNHWQQ